MQNEDRPRRSFDEDEAPDGAEHAEKKPYWMRRALVAVAALAVVVIIGSAIAALGGKPGREATPEQQQGETVPDGSQATPDIADTPGTDQSTAAPEQKPDQPAQPNPQATRVDGGTVYTNPDQMPAPPPLAGEKLPADVDGPAKKPTKEEVEAAQRNQVKQSGRGTVGAGDVTAQIYPNTTSGVREGDPFAVRIELTKKNSDNRDIAIAPKTLRVQISKGGTVYWDSDKCAPIGFVGSAPTLGPPDHATASTVDIGTGANSRCGKRLDKGVYDIKMTGVNASSRVEIN